MNETSSNNSVVKWLKLIGKIIFTAGIVVGLSVIIYKEYQHATVKKLNYFLPTNYQVLLDIEKGKEEIDETALRQMAFYHKMLSGYNSKRAPAFGLQGFCSHYLGDTAQAISFYQKAVEVNPYFFWYHYNLGVLYSKEGQYAQAIESLDKAIKAKPNVAMMSIKTSSRIYVQILSQKGGLSQEFIVGQLNDGRRNAYKLMIVSQYHLNNFPEILRLVDQGLQVYESDAAFYFYYAGLASYKLRNYKRAIEFLSESIKRAPMQSETYQALFDVWAALGDKVKAQSALQKNKILSQAKGNPKLLAPSYKLEIY